MIPPFHAFCTPALEQLAHHPDGVTTAALADAVGARLGLTPEERDERIPSGPRVVSNRLGWALFRLKRLGWATSPQRRVWQITPEGRARLANPAPITMAEIRSLDPRAPRARAPASAEPVPRDDDDLEGSTPRERIDMALAEIRAAVSLEVKQRIGENSPMFFEDAVLVLLHRMGYAGKQGSVQRTGRSGDGGIDGVVTLDRLGLERIYVQAKRWSGSVSSSTVRDFAGAMDAESATKGVIFTTSTFTRDAVAYVTRSPKSIRLVDGDQLAELMVEFGVGVSTEEVLKIPRIDGDFFDEG